MKESILNFMYENNFGGVKWKTLEFKSYFYSYGSNSHELNILYANKKYIKKSRS